MGTDPTGLTSPTRPTQPAISTSFFLSFPFYLFSSWVSFLSLAQLAKNDQPNTGRLQHQMGDWEKSFIKIVKYILLNTLGTSGALVIVRVALACFTVAMAGFTMCNERIIYHNWHQIGDWEKSFIKIVKYIP
jgi:hypothetical protein